MKRFVTLLVLIVMLGCNGNPGATAPESGPEKSATANNRSPMEAEQPAIQKTNNTPKELTEDQLLRMFSTTWIADDRLTRESKLNAEVNQKTLADAAWLFAIQKEYRLTFYDAGPKIRLRGDEELTLDLPARSSKFQSTFRWIDDNHIAMENDGHWLVFRAADADD